MADPIVTSSSEPVSGEGRVGPLTIGRYVLHAPIARGGMATIHLARLTGAEGFSRIVATQTPNRIIQLALKIVW